MTPNQIAATRHLAPRRAGGGFDIIRPRGNVAAKIIRELAEGLADVESSYHACEQRKGYAESHEKLSL